ncbi:MAG: glutamine-synthetase adenylyltransferase, partial [Alphaproteobacteria bacterium]|nr:glutamine-synthetase adenylyltransferase [Alphaproteobacteria bacterium]
MALVDQITPCGPVVDRKAAERAREIIAETVWDDRLAQAWPSLEPVFGASPYLASLARRDPERLASLLAEEPDARLASILARTTRASTLEVEAASVELRRLKAELHLLTALADLGGAWDLDQVTGALTRFADAAVAA